MLSKFCVKINPDFVTKAPDFLVMPCESNFPWPCLSLHFFKYPERCKSNLLKEACLPVVGLGWLPECRPDLL